MNYKYYTTPVYIAALTVIALGIFGAFTKDKIKGERPTPAWGIVVDRYHRPPARIICVDEAAFFNPSKTRPKITYTSRIQEESYILVIADSTLTEWNLEVERKQFFQANLMDTVSLKAQR